MASLKQHALLLFILAILIIAKFIIVPIFTWQDALIADIRLLEKKHDKITAVLANKNESASVQVLLNEAILPAHNLFFPYQTESAFKISQHKMLESLLVKHQLNAQNIGWETITQLENIKALRYQMQLRFTGKTTDVVEFITAIESYNHYIEIIDFNISLKGQQGNKLGRSDGRITLQLFADMNETVL